MTFQYANSSYIREKEIDWKKLKIDFMPVIPGFQKEIQCFQKAKIHGGKDAITGKKLPPTSWPRDEQAGEQAYYNWVKLSTDDDLNWNPARDERGNEVKGTGPKYVINGIIRVRTQKGEFLLSYGNLEGYDELGNKTEMSCNSPEKWTHTEFNYQMGTDDYGRIMRQVQGPGPQETRYEMPFNLQNLKELVKHRAGDNIPFYLKDEARGDNRSRSVPNQGSIEKTVEFFMQPFDYLFKAEYRTEYDKVVDKMIDKVISEGKANSVEEARIIALKKMEEEAEERETLRHKDAEEKRKVDKKSGVA